MSNTYQNDPVYQSIIQKIADLRSGAAGQIANIANSGMGSLGQGIAGNLQVAEAAQENALTNEANQRLAQLQNSQSALNEAAGLAKPVTGVAFGTQVFNPSTGTFNTGGNHGF